MGSCFHPGLKGLGCSFWNLLGPQRPDRPQASTGKATSTRGKYPGLCPFLPPTSCWCSPLAKRIGGQFLWPREARSWGGGAHGDQEQTESLTTASTGSLILCGPPAYSPASGQRGHVHKAFHCPLLELGAPFCACPSFHLSPNGILLYASVHLHAGGEGLQARRCHLPAISQPSRPVLASTSGPRSGPCKGSGSLQSWHPHLFTPGWK